MLKKVTPILNYCSPSGQGVPTILKVEGIQELDSARMKDRQYISQPGWCAMGTGSPEILDGSRVDCGTAHH